MYLKKGFVTFLFLFAMILISGCKKDDVSPNPPVANESEEVAKYLEANGNYINTNGPAMITAADIRNGQISGANQVVLDLRTNCDFHTRGHIEGAVLIQPKDIPWYYRNNNLASVDKVIITCATGQAASYVATLLRFYGYSNVYSMKWGMTSWNPACDLWTDFIGDSRASQFEKTEHAKNPKGSLPALSTGKSTPEEIVKRRVEDLLFMAFDTVQVSNDMVFLDLPKYYVIDYVQLQDYLNGHVPNSVQYSPKVDLSLSTNLKTLPTDKPIVVYCSTGQTSAAAAAYLNTVGYNVKSILYGCNGMNYTAMSGVKFKATEVNDYPVIR